jgi:hypothetical protein
MVPYTFMTSVGEAIWPRSLAGIAHSDGCFDYGAAALRMLLPTLIFHMQSTDPGTCCRHGNGRHFSRNPRAEEMLARLATELVKIDRNT